jgi:hypothetical protein
MPVTPDCRLCLGERWLCEAHPDRPWPHDDCPGAGDPCHLCNSGEPPDFPIEHVHRHDLDDPDGTIH